MTKLIQTYLADTTNKEIQQALWRILQAIDSDFVPSLSSRKSTAAMQLNPKANGSTDHLKDYFKELIQQMVVIAKVEDCIAGFLTFKHQYHIDLLPEYAPCNYITTIGVSPEYRNQGVGLSLYKFILTRLPAHLISPFWVTRTWSQNYSHLRLLNSLGFNLVKIIEHHRGPDLHTLYYAYN